jgi:cold-inducible RNA-binding protein
MSSCTIGGGYQGGGGGGGYRGGGGGGGRVQGAGWDRGTIDHEIK